MDMVIREDHMIRIPSGAVHAVEKRVSSPKPDLPPLPYAVLNQLTSIAMRINDLIADFSGEKSSMALHIEEALINAVAHGNESDVTREVRVCLRACLQDGIVNLEIRIEDEGVDLFSVDAEIKEALDVANLDRDNGRGLLMMRDAAGFSIEGPELLPHGAGKHLTFKKNIQLHPEHVLHSLKPRWSKDDDESRVA